MGPVLLRGSSSAELCFVSGCIAIALRLRHATSYRLVLDFRPLCDNLLVSGLDAARSASMLYSAETSFVMRPAASKFVVVTANARIWALGRSIAPVLRVTCVCVMAQHIRMPS